MLFALIATAYLSCDKPNMFFDDQTPGAYLSNPVPAEYVFDEPDANGKILRVTTNTAAFYYSVVCGYLERMLFTGDARARLAHWDEYMGNWSYFDPMSQQALKTNLETAYFKWNRLNDQGAVDILCSSNRFVSHAYRICEGDQTKKLCDGVRNFCFDKYLHYVDGSESEQHEWPAIYPTILENPEFNGRQLPRYIWNDDFNRIPEDFSDSNRAKIWMSWRSLAEDGIFMTNRAMRTVNEIHPELVDATDAMSRFGGSHTNLPSRFVTGQLYEPIPSDIPSVTNVVANYCGTNCLYAMTNDTRRFSYRRLCGLSWLLGLSDRSIINDSDSYGEPNFNNIEGYYNDLQYSGSSSFKATNFSRLVAGYDETHGYHYKVTFSQSDFEKTSDNVSVTTNASVYGGDQQIRAEASKRYYSGSALGTITMAGVADESRVKMIIPNDGMFHSVEYEFDKARGQFVMKCQGAQQQVVISIDAIPTNCLGIVSINTGVNVRFTKRPGALRFRDDDDYHPKEEEYTAPGSWALRYGYVNSQKLQVVGNIISRPRFFGGAGAEITWVKKEPSWPDDDAAKMWLYSELVDADNGRNCIPEIMNSLDQFWAQARIRFSQYCGGDVESPSSLVLSTSADAAAYFAQNPVWDIGDTITGEYSSYKIDEDGNLLGVVSGTSQVRPAVTSYMSLGLYPSMDSSVFKTKEAFSVAAYLRYLLLLEWKYKNLFFDN